MTALVDALRTVDFLQGEPETVVLAWLQSGRAAERGRAEILWRAGSSASGLVIPISGEAKSVACTPDGREFVDRLCGPGEYLGLTSALDGLPHETSAVVTRAGLFFEISRTAVLQFLGSHESVRHRVLQAVGRTYRTSVQDREDVVLRSASARLARFLVEHSCARGADGSKVLVQASQSDIGGRIGTVREVVARVLTDFEQRKLLSRTHSGWFVDDWDGLRAVARMDVPATEADAATQDAEAKVRTVRFLLLRPPGAAGAVRTDSHGCQDHLGDLSDCERGGCPIAAEEVAMRKPPNGVARDAAGFEGGHTIDNLSEDAAPPETTAPGR